MAKADSIADLKSAKQTQVDLVTSSLEAAKQSEVVFLGLIEDQSARAAQGVESFVLYDAVAPTIEATKIDGSEQSDLRGEVAPTTLSMDTYKTVPGYFQYILGENAKVGWVSSFLAEAPRVAILDVEGAAIDACIAIGAVAGHYDQLNGANLLGTANAAMDKANMAFGLDKLCQSDKINKSKLKLCVSSTHAASLPDSMFGLYGADASAGMGDEAKKNGFIGGAMGVPVFASTVLDEKALLFSDKSVSFAIRTESVDREDQPSKARDYYGIRISYGVVARSTNEAVVFGQAAAHDSNR